MKTKKKINPGAGANLALAEAMRGKAGNLSHGDRRTKRQRDRSSQRRLAIRDAS